MTMAIFDFAKPKITESTFTFPEFIPLYKKSVYFVWSFWDAVNFRVPWPDWPHPFLTMPTQKTFDQLLIFVNLYQHAKNQAISLFILEIWLIEKSRNLIGWEHVNPYLRNKDFPKYGICAETENNINFHYRTN